MSAIHIQDSLRGFIVSTPRLTVTENGDVRLWARIGQEHHVRQEDGGFAKGETSFHDLAIYRKTAERALERLKKGDRFVAQGYLRTYDAEGPDGTVERREEFVATAIGHDLARTRYTVNRARHQTTAPEQAVGLPEPAKAAEPGGIGR
ncbi:MAG: single-stranded DNA-binding protein [Bifidobacteriaceae bacterium]|nr:single-stranded DNA-binding protein [Bifidobacteriaceae bacterium]